MDKTDAFRGLHFDLRPRRISRRVSTVVAVGAIFTLMWWIVPHAALYWLLLPPVAILTWMASYGWREAIAILIRFLQSLEQQ